MKRQIVIFSGFNRAMFPHVGYNENGLHHSLTEEWIKPRADIWKKFTWQSILNQTHEDWVYCLCCSAEAKEITDRYFGDIHDDRFHLTYSDTQQELDVMKSIAKGMDELVSVRIDSDDMYHPKAIAELAKALHDKSKDWFMWRNGYCYQYAERNARMKHYKAKSSPFCARRYLVDDWIRQGIIAMKCEHHKVVKKHSPVILSDGKVLVGITGTNSSTLFKSPCFRNKVVEPEKSRVLKEFRIL